MAKKTQERIVQIPDSISVMRLRHGQYIGDNSDPSHLVHEAIDNFLDELRNGFGTEAALSFSRKNEVLVQDNGRGLPLGQTLVQETGEMIDSLEALFTKLHSGTKFSFADDQLETLFGQNGVGLVAINALSDYLHVRTKSEKKGYAWHLFFKDGILQSREEEEYGDKWSTELMFRPCKKFFGTIALNKEIFLDRLILAQAKLPQTTLWFNNKSLGGIGMEDYVRGKLDLSDETPLYEHQYQTKMEITDRATGNVLERPAKISVWLTYEAGDTKVCGDANLKPCDGTYLNGLQALIKAILPTKLEKRYQNVPERFLIEGLRLYSSIQIPLPEFDSQTKTRLINPLKQDLIDPLEMKLKKTLDQQYILDTIRDILDRKMSNKIQKTAKQKRISLDNKLCDCLNSPGTTLYLVEGDSANAAIRDARDKFSEACLPLRGKVINVENNGFDKITKNKEIKNILESVGSNGRYRYQNIVIMVDADVDGFHIAVLLVLIFAKYYPDLITEGRVKVFIPPLYGGKKGKKFVPIYSQGEIQKYRKQGFQISRFKGLGEMNGPNTRAVLDSKLDYTLKLPSDKELEDLIDLVTNSETKRRFLNLEDQYNFQKFFNTVLSEKE